MYCKVTRDNERLTNWQKCANQLEKVMVERRERTNEYTFEKETRTRTFFVAVCSCCAHPVTLCRYSEPLGSAWRFRYLFTLAPTAATLRHTRAPTFSGPPRCLNPFRTGTPVTALQYGDKPTTISKQIVAPKKECAFPKAGTAQYLTPKTSFIWARGGRTVL